MKKIINLALVAALVVTSSGVVFGCRGAAENAANLDCSASNNFNREQFYACAAGAKMARIASEGISIWTSVREARALLSAVRRKCDKEYSDRDDLVGACYTGVDYFKDRISSSDEK